jgi:hypothetical protein
MADFSCLAILQSAHVLVESVMLGGLKFVPFAYWMMQVPNSSLKYKLKRMYGEGRMALVNPLVGWYHHHHHALRWEGQRRFKRWVS